MALSDDAKELKDKLGEIQQYLKGSTDESKSLAASFNEAKNNLSSLVDIASASVPTYKQLYLSSREEIATLDKKLRLTKERLQLDQQNLASSIEKAKTEKTSLSNALNINKAERDRLENKRSLSAVERQSLTQINSLISQQERELENVVSQIGAAEEIQHQVNKALVEASSETEKLAREYEKVHKQKEKAEKGEKLIALGDKIQSPLDGILNIANLINKLIGFIFGQFKQVDDAAGKTAKSMNISYNEAVRMREEMAAAANASGELTLNSKAMEATLVNVNAALGSSVKYSDLSEPLKKDIQLMSQLEAAAGLTGEQTQAIMKYSMSTGQSAKNVTKELMASYKVQGLKSGLVLNEKDAMKAIEKTSKAIQMSYGGNAKELGKALAAAKGLGVELNKVDDIAGSLLNFEESIENELSAELLLGKDINLEKARQAALNGDLATVAEEITKQVGSAAEFSKMNRIQQEAMAKAVGMGREELAASLQEQEALKAMSAESADAAKEKFDKLVEQKGLEEAMAEMGDNALTKQFEQAALAEKSQLAQQKMADETMPAIANTLTSLSDNFNKIFQTIKYIIDKLGGMKTVMVAIGVIITTKFVMGLAKSLINMSANLAAARAYRTTLKAQQQELGPILAKEAAIAEAKIASANAATLGAGAIPIIAGITAVMALIGGTIMAAMNDGIIKPSGASGYGDRVLFGPEGAIKFNNKDTIIAGTDLFADDAVIEPGEATQSASKGEIKIKSGGGGGQDMSSVINAIDTLGVKVETLANRPINIYIDNKKLIEATIGAQPNVYGEETAINGNKMQ